MPPSVPFPLSFQVLPALDLRAGRVVRATDGFLYDADPVGRAAALLRDGATWLHLVDLDRAFQTGRDNRDVVRDIASLNGVRVQMGGFLATAELVREALDLGGARAVLSTATVVAPGRLSALVREFGAERLAAAIEVRRGRVTLRPSQETVTTSSAELAQRISEAGITTIVYRDLDRESTLEGADLSGAAALVESGAGLIVSGGIGRADHVTDARAAGLAGAILGRALHEGHLTMREALACSA